ncbi:MAG: glycosyltransferase family 2 protein [Flavobacteriaceae bacterium]|nr:glycosyltransferase family 2 protein [Flavobacteriaceae bacterium]
MSQFPSCSLITPTYNWPEALELLLLSIIKQSVLPNEVIVADDGSKKETSDLIKRFQKDFPVPLHHIWHEDINNRKPTIMNKAIASSKNNYIIEIDGDIIMHKDFIKDHLSLAEKDVYLYGSRVNIQEQYLKTLFKNKQINFNFFSKGIKKRGRTLHIPFLANRYKKESNLSSKLRGCNMSFWKDDFIKINGFNEELIGWGVDDSEMVQRLINNGIKGKRLKYKAIVYHIYHNEQDKSKVGFNENMERIAKEKMITHIRKGIDQYLKE